MSNKDNSTIRQYFFYDGRYLTDEDSAIVTEVCETYKEAKSVMRQHEGDILVEVTIKDGVIVEKEIMKVL